MEQVKVIYPKNLSGGVNAPSLQALKSGGLVDLSYNQRLMLYANLNEQEWNSLQNNTADALTESKGMALLTDIHNYANPTEEVRWQRAGAKSNGTAFEIPSAFEAMMTNRTAEANSLESRTKAVADREEKLDELIQKLLSEGVKVKL